MLTSTKDNIPKITRLNDCYVVSDFDRTLTVGNSKTSWALLSSTDFLPESYKREREAYYDYYRPIEIDTSLPFAYRLEKMNEWYRKHINLFVKYQLKEEFIKTSVSNHKTMAFREGAKEWLKFLYINHIPLIIISAGVGNFIEEFLQQEGCLYDNIYISSNMIKFENGLATGIENNVIHSLNKNEVSLPVDIKERLKDRKQVILLGDQYDDIRMVEEEKRSDTIRVGWLVEESNTSIFQKAFDIILSNDETYNTLGKKLFKNYEVKER